MNSAILRAPGERRFYLLITAVLIAVLLAGFSIDTDLVFHLDTLSWLVIVHGLLMFGWFIVFGVQTTLVAIGRTDLHRRFGIAGAILAATLVVVGVMTIVVAVQLGGNHMAPGLSRPVFLAAGFDLLFVFSVLVTCGIALRRRPDFHKRLMLLATIPLLDAAIVRFMGVYTNWTFDSDYIRNGLIFACIAIDTIRYRRLHPAFVAGCAFILVCDEIQFHVAATSAWEQFTAWVVGSA